MDRPIVYPGELLADTTLLNGWKSAAFAVGYLAQAALGGQTTVASGFPCSPTSPASMFVTVGNGSIYSYMTMDANPYGSDGLDGRFVIQQGLLLSPVSLQLTAPAAAGYSQFYLVQAAINIADSDPTLLSYFNSATPTQPFAGPNGGDGTQQYTTRYCTASIALKAGSAAPTGFT